MRSCSLRTYDHANTDQNITDNGSASRDPLLSLAAFDTKFVEDFPRAYNVCDFVTRISKKDLADHR